MHYDPEGLKTEGGRLNFYSTKAAVAMVGTTKWLPQLSIGAR
jgi:hypothetical protein